MAKIEVTIVATFKEYLEVEDYRDDFCEAEGIDEEEQETADPNALEAFALDAYGEALSEGSISFDELTCRDIEVTKKK